MNQPTSGDITPERRVRLLVGTEDLRSAGRKGTGLDRIPMNSCDNQWGPMDHLVFFCRKTSLLATFRQIMWPSSHLSSAIEELQPRKDWASLTVPTVSDPSQMLRCLLRCSWMILNWITLWVSESRSWHISGPRDSAMHCNKTYMAGRYLDRIKKRNDFDFEGHLPGFVSSFFRTGTSTTSENIKGIIWKNLQKQLPVDQPNSPSLRLPSFVWGSPQ